MTSIRRPIGPLLLAPLALASSVSAQCELPPLRPDAPQLLGEFGNRCSVSGDLAVISDPSLTSMRVWTFERQGPNWIQRDVLSGFSGGGLGGDVAVSGTTLFVGRRLHPAPNVSSGAAVVFDWNGTAWVESQVLEPSPAAPGDWFGSALDVDGDRAIVSAPGYGGGPNDAYGAVFVFERSGGAWTQVAQLFGDNPASPAFFGQAVSLLGERALVGAPGEQAAYLFEDGAAGWSKIARFPDPVSGPDSSFGSSVALGNGIALVGDSFEDLGGTNAGAVHVFEQTPGGWVPSAALLEPLGGPQRQFGRGLALDGDALLAGAPVPVVGSTPSAWQFTRSASGWIPVAQYVPGDAGPSDASEFGSSIGADAGVALIGAQKLDGAGGQPLDAGAVHAVTFQHDVRPYCACAAAAPCGNSDPHAGCANSTGVGGLLLACGTPSASADDLTLTARRLPSGQPALLFAGTQAIAGGAGVVLGDGLRCAGGSVVRLGTVTTAGGSASFGPGVAGLGGWSAGDLRHLQVWYRDPNAGPCGSGFNLTNALEVLFGI